MHLLVLACNMIIGPAKKQKVYIEQTIADTERLYISRQLAMRYHNFTDTCSVNGETSVVIDRDRALRGPLVQVSSQRLGLPISCGGKACLE